jgi:hypothetical protein
VRRAILILALVAAALPARARLGETEAESIARYGPVVGAYDAGTPGYPYRTLTFAHAGYTIIVQFMGGACAMVCFQKPDGSALTPDELDLLLKAQAEGQAWSRSNLVSSDVIFDRPDGAMARYDTAQHALLFCSARYVEATDAHRKADEKKQLENL